METPQITALRYRIAALGNPEIAAGRPENVDRRLAEDLAAILAMTDDDNASIERLLGDEHLRYDLYQRALSLAAHEDDLNDLPLLQTVLRDPDSVMAQAAVTQHIASRAGQSVARRNRDTFARWAATIADTIEPYDFLVRRTREWAIFLALRSDLDGAGTDEQSLAELTQATDWLQRTIAETSTNRAALTELAHHGRTRRVRAMAARRIPKNEPGPGKGVVSAIE